MKTDVKNCGPNLAYLKTVMLVAFGAALLAMAPTSAKAQVALPARVNLLPTTNTKEIEVNGNFQLDQAKLYDLAIDYGDFLSPSVEVGVQGAVSGTTNSGGQTITTIGAIADYYFNNTPTNTTALLPFAGVFAGYENGAGSSSSFGVQAGVKYFFNPNVAGDVEYDYRSLQHNGDSNTIMLGLSTFFH
jgi:opacity protein-like surface antigen